MKNFDYYNPVKILFGEGKIDQIPTELKQGDKILLTYGGGSIKKNGTYDKVMKALQGFQVTEFGGIEANPKFETLIKAVQIVKEHKIDFILAVGGGSVIDGTKFIAAAALYDGKDPWDILVKGIKVEKAVPFGSVLTLPATGSEMNSGAVISRLSTKEKYAFGSPVLFPKFSVLDPTTTLSLPPRQVANGIVDAYIHTVEQYLTYPSNSPIQDKFAESILKTLIEVGPKTLSNPDELAHRANFMWSCTMALNGLIATGVPTDWATHMIGHELTAFFGLDHGVTLAIVYPALLREMVDFKKDKLFQYGEEVWGIKNDGRPETIDKIINKTEEFFHSLGVKTKLSNYGITKEQTRPIVERFMERGWKLGEQKNITHDVVERILDRALS
ncbi:MAG TPA: iron-containing alcohol dehydrogenase [Tenuifilaceae bacterium]|nr:iron-containing alcohol dehydrogenase [Tenuifilaceae bacterium]HPI45015.1 iron-containing alcohol dehydrogenase [Tenuifilaceae bacterium]HPN22001.1 iron-containing alcohol dehydrogenase [Tenuifilaceae bacterium]